MGSTDEFLLFFTRIDTLKALWPNLYIDGFNISTATILAHSKERVDLKHIAAVETDPALASFLDPGRIHSECPEGELSIKWSKQRQKKAGEFGNQTTMAFSSISKRSIKIFSCGGIHVTGCKNTAEFQRIASVIEGLLFACGALNTRWRLEAPKIVMLNFNFDIHRVLSLRKLSMIIHRRFGIHSTHETESHPALMTRFVLDGSGKSTLVMIFNSGKILVSSPLGLQGVLMVFRLVCQLINDELEFVEGTKLTESKVPKKRKLDVWIQGYPSGQALPCLSSKRTIA